MIDQTALAAATGVSLSAIPDWGGGTLTNPFTQFFPQARVVGPVLISRYTVGNTEDHDSLQDVTGYVHLDLGSPDLSQRLGTEATMTVEVLVPPNAPTTWEVVNSSLTVDNQFFGAAGQNIVEPTRHLLTTSGVPVKVPVRAIQVLEAGVLAEVRGTPDKSLPQLEPDQFQAIGTEPYPAAVIDGDIQVSSFGWSVSGCLEALSGSVPIAGGPPGPILGFAAYYAGKWRFNDSLVPTCPQADSDLASDYSG